MGSYEFPQGSDVWAFFAGFHSVLPRIKKIIFN